MSRIVPRAGMLAFGMALVIGCGKKPAPPAPEVPPAETPSEPVDPKAELAWRWKRVAVAIADFVAHTGRYPAGVVGPGGTLGLSWRVQLLPHLGRNDLYQRFKLDEAWDSEHNKSLLGEMPELFATPGDASSAGKTHLRAFRGDGAILWRLVPPHGAKVPFPNTPPGTAAPGYDPNRIHDGTSNTVVAVEASEAVEWTRPDDLPFGPIEPGKFESQFPIPKLGRTAADGFFAIFCDSTVWLLPKAAADADVRALGTAGFGDQLSKGFNDLWEKVPRVHPRPARLHAAVPAGLPDAAARTTAVERYQTIHRAIHAFAARNDGRMPGGFAGRGGPGLSWRVQLLPFLGEEQLYKQFKLDEPWDSPTNKVLLDRMPQVFESPGAPAEKGSTRVRTTEKPGGVIPGRAPMLDQFDRPVPSKPGDALRGVKVKELRVGNSSVTTAIMLLESSETPWTKPDELPLPAAQFWDEHTRAEPPARGGTFDGGFHGVGPDGRVTFFKSGYPNTLLMRLLVGGYSGPFDPLLFEEHVLYSIPPAP